MKFIIVFALMCVMVFSRQFDSDSSSSSNKTNVKTNSPVPTVAPVATEAPAIRLEGRWSSEPAYIRGDGSYSAYFETYKDVTNCKGLTLNIEISNYTGYPFDDWYLYTRDLSGNWAHVAKFTLEDTMSLNKTYSFPLRFDTAESFDALAICHVADGYVYTVNYNIWYTDLK